METKVIDMRREVLPEKVFRFIEGFMLGDIVTLHLTGLTRDGRVISTVAGKPPPFSTLTVAPEAAQRTGRSK